MRNLALALLLTGCGSTLPQDTMTRFAETLELTKAAFSTVCGEDKLAVMLPETAGYCELARARINDAIGVYTELNDQLKDE